MCSTDTDRAGDSYTVNWKPGRTKEKKCQDFSVSGLSSVLVSDEIFGYWLRLRLQDPTKPMSLETDPGDPRLPLAPGHRTHAHSTWPTYPRAPSFPPHILRHRQRGTVRCAQLLDGGAPHPRGGGMPPPWRPWGGMAPWRLSEPACSSSSVASPLEFFTNITMYTMALFGTPLFTNSFMSCLKLIFAKRVFWK